jgi:hypothetical protein
VISDPYERLVDPDEWASSRCMGTRVYDRAPCPGELIGYRYSVWRVDEVRVVDDTSRARRGPGPFDLELVHVSGPQLDGSGRLRVEGEGIVWRLVSGRFPVCSCHGHPWPCLGHDRDVLASALARKGRRDLAGAVPDVCAACVEPFTVRQPRVVFPGLSLIVPGAPGPSFHARRSSCWWAAHRYEIERRLPADPDADRVASCPGVGFVHNVGLGFECTAGPACTGLHGPRPKPRHGSCATRTYRIADGLDRYDRPLTDCGFRAPWGACLGAETGPCQPSVLSGVLGC